MKTSPAGRKVLAEREGRRLQAYRDSVGVWTIGIGHTSAAGPPQVGPGLTITEPECDAIFARDLAAFEASIEAIAKVPLAQHEFDALVSFCYNVGQAGLARSTVARRLNAGDRQGAADALLMWNKPAAVLSRRRAERAQFLGHGYPARLGPDERSSPRPRSAKRPQLEPVLATAVLWWRRLFAPRATPITLAHTEAIPMLNPMLPLAISDLIRRAVEQAAERPDVDIPAGQKEIIAAEVVREAQNLPELRRIEQAATPKSRWRSKGMIGALVSGLAGIAGAFGFALAPEEVDAVIGLISNAIVVAGAVMAWFGRKNATQPVA
jgi:lysozyme